jgi:hypothetical protein
LPVDAVGADYVARCMPGGTETEERQRDTHVPGVHKQGGQGETTGMELKDQKIEPDQ